MTRPWLSVSRAVGVSAGEEMREAAIGTFRLYPFAAARMRIDGTGKLLDTRPGVRVRLQLCHKVRTTTVGLPCCGKDPFKSIAEDNSSREHNCNWRGSDKFPALRGPIMYPEEVPPPNTVKYRCKLNKTNKLHQQPSPKAKSQVLYNQQPKK